MNRSLKISVLGPIPRDSVVTHNNESFEKYGCVLYTAVALSGLVGNKGRIVPVTHLCKSDEGRVRTILSQFPNVDLNHVSSDADRGDIVSLRYLDQNTRIERQTGFMNPIGPDDLGGLLDSDAFICVPISDYEVPCATLAHIKANSAGIVILDAHGPTNAVTRSGQRVHKFWFERDLWLPYVDILKMNLQEAGCSWFGPGYLAHALENPQDIGLDELPKLAAHCLRLGVKAVCVTLDQHGCVIYFRDVLGGLQERFVKRVAVDQVTDTTGCGDSFAAGFAFGFLKTGDYVKACQFGNAVGAQRCAGTELAIYRSLEDTERQIAETYGESNY
jgi:pfkB family carbohydrate kinase